MNIASQMVDIIHAELNRDISLEQCAHKLNFHPVYLSRVFSREMGMSFSQYVIDCRMRVARQMLENTEWKVNEIGDRLQYTNTSSFIRAFRKNYAMTPGQYRESMQQEASAL